MDVKSVAWKGGWEQMLGRSPQHLKQKPSSWVKKPYLIDSLSDWIARVSNGVSQGAVGGKPKVVVTRVWGQIKSSRLVGRLEPPTLIGQAIGLLLR